MKSIKYIIGLLGGILFLLPACNDSFMERYPETSLSEETFFQNVKDLETYTNGLYGIIPVATDDIYSDNISIYGGGSEFDNLIRGQITPENVGGWKNKGVPADVEDDNHDDWGTLRKCNVLLVNAYKAEGDESEINHYVGIARFFRAWFYFTNLKRYGSVPWYSKPMTTADEDLLYKGMDTRELVVDSIMADLEFAATHVKPISSRTRINQWAALQLLARFSLFEGTYRKYHTDLNLTATANTYLEKAVWAAGEIMKGDFAIVGSSAADYQALFTSGDLSSHPEILLFMDYDKVLGRTNNTSSVLDWQWQLSRSLADSYLKTDGTPISADPSYATREFKDVFTNRDPRMAETIMPPGFVSTGGTRAYVPNPTYGGYAQVKFYPRSEELYGGYGSNANDIPIFRYAETLLIYAEAKAELGQITQNDIDQTINKLRDRVGMSHLIIGAIVNDPVLANQYPAVTSNVLLEIRRERRVELACEGLRQEDLKRWRAGKLLEEPSEGMYIQGFGPLDITGDGVADIAIYRTPADNVTPDLVTYTLFDENGSEQAIYLSEGDKGYIRFVKNKNIPINFIEPKYYYTPIPFKQVQLNPNLTQPTGW